MRHLITPLIVVMGCFVWAAGFGTTTHAQTLITECGDTNSSICADANQGQQLNNNKFYGPDGLLTKVARIIAYIGGIAAVIMIILGGFTFITGSGDPNALAAAKKTVLYAAVGLIVLVLPTAIIQYVLSKL